MGDIYIGVMSGTSQDGVDCAAVEFFEHRVSVLASHVHRFPQPLLERIAPLLANTPIPPAEFGGLDAALGELLATAVVTLLEQASLSAADVVAIGSHGHTIYHQPPQKDQPGFTMQLGDPNILAARTGIVTVADLRRMDTAMGGEGAPLVPAFHQWLWSHDQETRVVANIGGIANITILAPGRSVIGFDTGPGNTLLDQWCVQHLNKPFDDQGRWARGGGLEQTLLERLLADPYFTKPPPKSTGREYFNNRWLERILRDGFGKAAPPDVARTLTELTARTLTDAIEQHAADSTQLIVAGGGSHNLLLLERLAALTPGRVVKPSDHAGLAADWVEAAAFAWLARQRLANEPSSLPTVTGARQPAILGAVYSVYTP